MKYITTLTMALTLPLLSQAGERVFAPTGPGGTYNAYELFTASNGQFDTSRAQATTMNLAGTPGHLVTITSRAENGIPRNAWIGLTDSTGVSNIDGFNYSTLGTSEEGAAGPGANDGRVQTGAGFRWVTGETVSYRNFGGGEPNDFDAANGGEDAIEITGDGFHNDNDQGNTFDIGNNGAHATERFFGAVAEYDLNLPLASMGSLLANTWTITSYKSGSTDIRNLAGADALIAGTDLSGSWTSYSTIMDFSDSGGDGDFTQGSPRFGVYGMNNDDNFAVVGNTKLDITAGEVGVPIVFRINADDGQRLQIDINQDGDFDDAGELVINDDVLSGDHNVDSPGLTFSAAGAYAIRYTFFEAGGGAEGEVSASVDGDAFFLVGGAGGLGIVPEPGVTALAGLVGLLGLTRRRR